MSSVTGPISRIGRQFIAGGLAGADAKYHFKAVFLILAAVLLANAPTLLGFSHCDPEGLYSGLTHGMKPGYLTGQACFFDPAPAYYTQPLGRLSASDWLHGVVPWWNPYSGIGMPLAAEAQNESLFLPFVLLLIFHNDWLLQRLAFQILSGLFTYAF